ncbi:MAG: formyltetrahydrofolate deformylase [Candidatus Omnitrophica bacterium]|nr:formyltetrahydrofolate deformylase [Candidatus Omnitrophota bacterium]
MNTATLLISCPDQKGITATIANFIYKNNGNIEHADQHIDANSNTFFMRIEWSLKGFIIPKKEIAPQFSKVAKKFNMNWSLYFSDDIPKIAIFVSKATYCLYDLLLKHEQDYFSGKIALIISNHDKASTIAKRFGIKFYHYPKNNANKRETEKKELKLLQEEGIELIVLAHYLQIFTKQFTQKYPNSIINIHHSFLPAFAGSNPYRQAYQRGVKIIGATSHYINEKLDSGPIIEQDVIRVDHRRRLLDLKREGQEIEKMVLNRAVRWHLERKILVYGNKTVIFD